MSVEPLKKVVKMWNNRWLTKEQAIGKILLLLQQLERRVAELETLLFGPDEDR